MTHTETGPRVGPLDTTAIAGFRKDGYLLLPPDFLSPEVLAAIDSAMPEVLGQEGPQRILERDNETVRSVYGPHRTAPAIAAVARDPLLLNAARQLLGGEVYVHQSKVNVKAPFAGDQWEWHQDFVYWLQGDGIQQPDMLNVAVFLDEVTEFNGPLTFVPGSQNAGVLSGRFADGMPMGYEDAPAWVATLTAEEQFHIDTAVITGLAARHGLVSPKGPAGSVLLFDPNILHSSGPNISPFRRAMLMFVYNSVDNAPIPVANPRPDFLAEPDTTALTPR